MRDVILKPISLTWVIVTGGASLIGIFGLPTWIGTAERLLGVLVVALGVGFVLMLWYAWELYERARIPVQVRAVVNGSHHYRGTLVVILDAGNWVEPEQVLVLAEAAKDVQSPLALLRVETFTTKGYPQAVVLQSLTDEDLSAYLSDASRWRSMFALSEIKFRYLQGEQND